MSCIYKIKEGRKSFTSTEKRIADYILNYRLETVEASVQDLAERTNTSAAAWIRFSKKLGYKGLTALKMDLAKNDDDNEKDELFNVLIKENDSIDVMVRKVQQISLHSIEQTYKLLNLNTLKNAIQLIIHARNIYLIGIGGSGLVCTDFMHKLTRVNHNVIYHEDPHILLARIAHMQENDVLVAISYIGETHLVNVGVEKAKELNIPIIAITQYNVRSTLSKLADINLYTPVIEKDLRLGAISSRNASLELTDLIYYGVIKENIDQAKKDLTKTRELIHEVNNK